MPREPSDNPRQPAKMDDDSEAIIYQGANMSQLSRLFQMDARDIKKKILGHVAPVAVRKGSPIYQVRAVAPFLVSPPYDIDEFIQRMSIADLPTVLRKEFWAGMRSRQLYEKEAAEVWSTAQVIDTISDLLKTVRVSLLLIRESVERETEVTPEQRKIITKAIDNALEETHRRVKEHFESVRAEAERAKAEHDKRGSDSPEPIDGEDDEL